MCPKDTLQLTNTMGSLAAGAYFYSYTFTPLLDTAFAIKFNVVNRKSYTRGNKGGNIWILFLRIYFSKRPCAEYICNSTNDIVIKIREKMNYPFFIAAFKYI